MPVLPSFKLAPVFAGTALLAACATPAPDARELMDEALNGQFTSYSNVTSYGGGVTCGEYLFVTAIGEFEMKDFVVIGTEANPYAGKLDNMVYCTEDPVAGLNEALDIDFEAQRETILQIASDFENLAVPLLAYEKDNGHFPWTEQGLDALITPTQVGNRPKNFPEGGYTGEIPKDPWGNDYVYDCPSFAGVRIMYTIKSLGADGEPGGTGADADIDATHVKYIRHAEAS